MDTAGWIALVVAAIGAIGSICLQALHMYLSYKRDTAIGNKVEVVNEKVETVAKATDGLTDKIVTAELTAERVVTKAETAAKALITTAAQAAISLREGESTTP